MKPALTIACSMALLLVVAPFADAEEAAMTGQQDAPETGTGLIAHWKLEGDCKDLSGNGLDGVNHGVDLTAHGGARFDGRGSHIEVPDSPYLHLGDRDFSIVCRVHTAEELDDVLGDIVGKFDPIGRKGLNFCIQNFHGVTSTQSNFRNVFFGIDDARLEPQWTDCGRPGDNMMVWALCVYAGDLYAGTFETGKDQAGHVYRYTHGDTWVDCGSPYPSNAVTSLAVYDGKLYAAASHYRSGGSALAESDNTVRGGRVFRYEGGTDWTNCGQVADIEGIGGMTVFKGKLYASSIVAPPGLYRYEGGTTWTDCGNPGGGLPSQANAASRPGGRVESLAVYDGHLYGSGWDQAFAGVYRFNGSGTAWTDCGTPPGVTQTYSFAILGGRMYVGTWPGGRVFRYGGGRSWEDCGQLGSEREVMGMAVYNGKLYAGTLPLAQVYRYDGDGAWTPTGRLDTTDGVKYRRVWSMAVFQGKLFAGVLPSGHVHAIEAGNCVTCDHELAPGWRQLAAVREGGLLKLYVDGELAAASTPFDGAGYNITNTCPLTIGFGAHDYFNGRIKDLCIYGRALTVDEMAALK